MRTLAALLLITVGCSSTPGGGRDPQGSGGAPAGGTGGGAAGGRGGNGGGGAGGQGGTGGGGAGGQGAAGAAGGAGGQGVGGGGGAGGQGVGGGGGAGGQGAGGTGGAVAGGDAGGDTQEARDGTTPPLAGTAFLYAAGAEFGGAQITTFGFNLASGAISRKAGGTAAGASPDYVATHPSGKFLYVNNETGAGRATAFSIAADGGLTMLNSAASGGGGPAHIWVHKSGKWLLSANYNDGRLGVARIGDDGRLTATSSAAAGGNAHMALDDGVTGNFVFVPCASAGHVAMFKFDVATGQAMPNSPATIPAPGRPRHMAFNPSGKWAYVTHETRTDLTTYAYDSTTGLLSAPRDTTAPNDGAHVLVHPSGTFVFHIARGGGTVTVFRVAADGALSEASKVSGGGYDGTITPDGKYLVVVSGSSIRVYAVNPTTGALTSSGNGQAAGTSQSVAVAVF
jgi:6-phosphogluconolactonase